jgi:hypothetical protein
VRLLNRVVIALALAATSLPASAATFHTDTFDADLLGWAGGFTPPNHVNTGGPAGVGDGYLRVNDNEHVATHNVSPAWTGDMVALGATRVDVDLMSPASSPALEIRLVLFATDSVRWTSSAGHVVPNDGVWRRYAYSMAESALIRVQGDVTNTYAGLMSSVTRVMLRYDSVGAPGGSTTAGGTFNVDNAELAGPLAVPGDFDLDGDVDGNDLNGAPLGWKARFGTDLEGEDFLVWQRNLGTTGFGAATIVPEPTAAALAMFATFAGYGSLFRNRRRCATASVTRRSTACPVRNSLRPRRRD